MIIVLMGYMGSGKSTIGANLASVLDYEFIDLDDFIESEEKETIPSIFKKRGEIYFRKLETKYLEALTTEKDNLVLALGGGTPCYGNNLKLILKNKNVRSFYLKITISSLIDRLKFEKNKRPLISHIDTEEDLQEFIGKHLFERSQFYSQANFTVESDNKTIKDITEDILMRLI